MQTLKVKARADEDGMIHLKIPTRNINQELEIVVVMQVVANELVDAMGYPIGYFDATYGSLADDLIERNQPAYSDVRDKIE